MLLTNISQVKFKNQYQELKTENKRPHSVIYLLQLMYDNQSFVYYICNMNAMGFLKEPSPKRAEKLINMRINQLQIMTGPLTWHCHLQRYVFKLRLIDCARWMQTGT
jgi:hypothetical protein